MREIKFRGKSFVDNDWTYGFLVVEGSSMWINHHFIKGEWKRVKPETVGQFTGLFDKNGKEVYQSDLGWDSNGNLYEIAWMDREAGWGVKNLTDTGEHPECNPFSISYGWVKTRKFEVIGNVCKNPDILGGDK